MNPGTSNTEHRTPNFQCFPFARTLTPALSHPMGEREVVPVLGQIRGRVVARVQGLVREFIRGIFTPVRGERELFHVLRVR